jgi:hypothetical protein
LASDIQNVVFKLQKILNQEMVDEELAFELRSQNPHSDKQFNEGHRW